MMRIRPTLARSLFALAAIVAMTAGAGAQPAPGPRHESADAAVRALVTRFGAQLQNVSLLAPDVPQELDTTYGSLVDPSLLAAWKKDVQSAPGRLTSSPWPDHIEIHRVRRTATGYSVTASVVYMTSNEVEHGGDAGTDAVVITVRRIGGRWLIASYTLAKKKD
ncbi:MAG: hypothetical protein KGN76_09205 [Acidobacteriota bacterium]|nr:hypothetical protein [Acidobacteriota bacterium]